MNNKGIGAVLGIILMVGITVAVAFTVYYYISTDLFNKNNCLDSYDNLILKHGWVVINSDCDCVTGLESDYKYFVSYEILQTNSSCNGCTVWLHGFIYDKEIDYLYFLGESEYVIGVNNDKT